MAFAKLQPAIQAPAPGKTREAAYRSERTQRARNRQNRHADPDKLTCSNCREPYSIAEARVQRSLRQFFAEVKPSPSSVTPRLCWVCTHLYYAAHQPEGLDKLWDGFKELAQ
jgi:hypothetical protein